MHRFFAAVATAITIGSTCWASDIPTTNWGAVLKVPLDKVEEVDAGLIEWGNWITVGMPGSSPDSHSATPQAHSWMIPYAQAKTFDTEFDQRQDWDLFHNGKSSTNQIYIVRL